MFVLYYYLAIKLHLSNTLEVGCYLLTISVPSSETSKLTTFLLLQQMICDNLSLVRKSLALRLFGENEISPHGVQTLAVVVTDDSAEADETMRPVNLRRQYSGMNEVKAVGES